MRSFSDQIFQQAEQVLGATKSIDFQKIMRHDKVEVAKLKLVLQQLGIGLVGVDVGLADTHSAPVKSAAAKKAPSPAPAAAAAKSKQTAKEAEQLKREELERKQEELQTRRKQIVDQLARDGLGPRVGKVYDSFSPSRTVSFKDVPHRRGLVGAQMVVAPDFSPQAGMHAILVTQLEVMSAVLAAPAAENDWKVLKRKQYTTMEEMTEYVTLLSAGFDLP